MPSDRRPGRISAVGFAAAIGAVAGASLAARRGVRWVAAGVLTGATVLAAGEAVARARQRPGEIPALPQRILDQRRARRPAWLAGARLTGAGPLAVGTAAGAVAGALGLRPLKVALGPAVGFTRRRRCRPDGGRAPSAAAVAAATVVTYRTLSAAVFRDAQVSLLAERVRPRSCPSSSRWPPARATSAPATCASWPRRWAAPTPPTPPTSASSPRSTSWPGPTSTPPRSTRGCGEFYEHTTRFTLDIVPRVADLGTARLPAVPDARRPPARPGQRADEPARGVARRAQPHRHDHRRRRRSADGTIAVRGWIRSFADTDEPIYVGIYTTYRHDEPRLRQRRLPGPSRQLHRHARAAARDGGGLTLTSHGDGHAGHYLTYIDPETGELTTLAVHGFGEQLDVYVDDGELRAEHAFTVFGLPFLVLHYRIRPKGEDGAQ